MNLTDAFCGFKAYRSAALERFDITDNGYAMPLQVWVQAVACGLKIVEVPVELIYLDESRAFGGSLDDASLPLAALSAGLRERDEARRAAGSGRVSWMTPRQLRAPAIDGGLLVDPPPGSVPGDPGSTTARASHLEPRFPGPHRRPPARAGAPRGAGCCATAFSSSMASTSRAFLVTAANEPIGPLVVTGHQPELFHPGVWIKNFAAAGIAAEHRGVALNLIVDNDLPKSASIRVPRVEDGLVRTTQVDFDRWGGRDSVSKTCASRTKTSSRPSPTACASGHGRCRRRPVLDDFWPRVLARRARNGFARAAVLAGPPRARGRLGRIQPRGSPERRLPDRRLLLVRLPPAGPSAQLPADPQRRAGGIPAGARNSQQEPPRRRPRRARRMARSPVLGLAPRAIPGAAGSWPGCAGGKSTCGSPAKMRSWSSFPWAPIARPAAPSSACATLPASPFGSAPGP